MHTDTDGGFQRRKFLQWFLEAVVSKFTNKHGKRVLFVASLHAQLVRLDCLKAEAVGKLNVLMNLALREDALALPAALSDKLWHGVNLQAQINDKTLGRELTEELAWSLAGSLVKEAPKCLDYGFENMVTDVFDLIRNGRDLPHASMAAA